jgi:hypothetical protein
MVAGKGLFFYPHGLPIFLPSPDVFKLDRFYQTFCIIASVFWTLLLYFDQVNPGI